MKMLKYLSTILPKNSVVLKQKVYFISKRYHGNIVQKVLSPQLQQELTRLYYNKQVIYHYCSHFINVPIKELLNDVTFVKYMDKFIHAHPVNAFRTVQLLLERSYNLRKFNEKDVIAGLGENIILQDVFKVNRGIVDQSTIYTGILTKILQAHLNLQEKEIILSSTPVFSNKTNFDPLLQETFAYNQQMTGNSCPDLYINSQPYDYKDTKEINYNKNHIYFFTDLDMNKMGQHLLKLISSFDNVAKTAKTSIVVREYVLSLKDFIVEEMKLNINPQIVYKNLVNHIQSNPRPIEAKVPIFVSINTVNTMKEFVITEKELSQVPLTSGKITDVKAHSAMVGLMAAWPMEQRIKVNQATHSQMLPVDNNKPDIIIQDID